MYQQRVHVFLRSPQNNGTVVSPGVPVSASSWHLEQLGPVLSTPNDQSSFCLQQLNPFPQMVCLSYDCLPRIEESSHVPAMSVH